MSAISKSTWKCEGCKDEVSSLNIKSDDETSDNMQSFDMMRALRSAMNEKLDNQIQRFDRMETNYTSLTNSFKSLNATVESFKNELEDLKKEVSQLKLEKNELALDVASMKDSMHELQQYSRKTNLEVRGVPMTRGEDVYNIVKTIAAALEVPYVREDVSVAHRLRGSAREPHPAIIIQFIFRTTRSNWLSAVKRMYPKLSTTDLHRSLTPGPVFINDHLSPGKRELLGTARRMVRDKIIAFAWTSDGKVLVRMTPDSSAIRFKHLSDLKVSVRIM